MLAVSSWCVAMRGTYAAIDVTTARRIESEIVRLQRRAGQLSSFKASELMTSEWPLGVAPAEGNNVTDTIGYYRIIGNPLPPRHDAEQLHLNLRYLLKFEKNWPSVKKIFVLNRLTSSIESFAKGLIESYGHEVLVIKFDEEEYKAYQTQDTYGLHPDEWGPYNDARFSNMNANLYLMNNNGARNAALRDGVSRGFRWTLPFDGNCFFSTSEWYNMIGELDDSEKNGLKFAAIPMVRTSVTAEDAGRFGNEDMPGLTSSGDLGEHQIAFHHSAPLRFDPTIPYGHRPKVSMLWKLSIPGAWDKWNHDLVFRSHGVCVYLGIVKKVKAPSVCSRTLPITHEEAELEAKQINTTVFRLPDSWKSASSMATTTTAPANQTKEENAEAWRDNYAARRNRKDLRDAAILLKIGETNSANTPSTRDTASFRKPLLFNVFSMEAMRRECIIHKSEGGKIATKTEPTATGRVEHHHCEQIESLVALAERHLDDKPFSVVDKESIREQLQQRRYDDRDGNSTVKPIVVPPNATANHYLNLGTFFWRIGELPDDVDASQLKRLPSTEIKADFAVDLQSSETGPSFRKRHAEDLVRWEKHMRQDSLLWGAGSEAYDRTRAYEMMTNVTMYALAHFYTGQLKYAEKAVSLIRTWFLDPATRMIPSLAYVQWSKPPTETGSALQLKDLTYTFDALALIQRSTAWEEDDERRMREWCSDYKHELANVRDRPTKSAHGWWQVLQITATSRCADESTTASAARVKLGVEKLVNIAVSRHEAGSPAEVRNGTVFSVTYAHILAWRLLQNYGEEDLSNRLATLIRQRVDKLLADTNFPQNPESMTPVCQWALDYDANYADSLEVCKRRQRSHADKRRRMGRTPFPSATVEMYRMPPLLPTTPSRGIFPFTNLIW